MYKRTISSSEITTLPSGKPPEHKVLEGIMVLLEPLDPLRHADELFQASHEDEKARLIWNYLPHGPFYDNKEFTRWLKTWPESTDYVFYAIRDKNTRRASGMSCYLDIYPDNGVIEIGYIWFAPIMQRTRQATEALFLMLHYAFDDLKYRRMQWRCNALNEKSRQAAVRLGFQFEGIFYNHMIVKGHNRDTAWYSILDSEWPKIRSNFERWLADENFDINGQQRLSLSKLNESRE